MLNWPMHLGIDSTGHWWKGVWVDEEVMKEVIWLDTVSMNLHVCLGLAPPVFNIHNIVLVPLAQKTLKHFIIARGKHTWLTLQGVWTELQLSAKVFGHPLSQEALQVILSHPGKICRHSALPYFLWDSCERIPSSTCVFAMLSPKVVVNFHFGSVEKLVPVETTGL